VIFKSNPASLVAAAVFSLIPATVSYQYLEQPLRQYQTTTRSQVLTMVTLTVFPTLMVCVALLIGNAHGYWSPSVQKYQAGVDVLHTGKRAGCGTGYVPNSLSDGKCDFNSGAGKPIYVIGDSNADHLSEAIIHAGRDAGRPVKIFTMGGCGLIGKSWSNASDAEQRDCRAYVDGAVNYLASAPDGTVVLGLSDSIWRTNGVRVGDTRDTELSDPKEQWNYLQRELMDLISTLRRDGHQILLVQSVPKFVTQGNRDAISPERCMTIEVMEGACPGRVTLTAGYEDVLQQGARSAISAAARDTGSKMIDVQDTLCPNRLCSNIAVDGTILYRDSGHLSIAGSERLAGDFSRVLSN
jgi:hypothetical protein